MVLGIPVGSPERDIRRAYRRLAKQLHPDRAAPADRAAAHTRFIELQAAYEAMLAGASVVEVGGEEGRARPREAAGGFRPAEAVRGVASAERGSEAYQGHPLARGLGLVVVLSVALALVSGGYAVCAHRATVGPGRGEQSDRAAPVAKDEAQPESEAPGGGQYGPVVSSAAQSLERGNIIGDLGENASEVKEMFSSGSMSEPPVPRVDVCDRNGMLRAAIEEGTGSGALGEAEGGQTNTEAPEAWPPPSALVPGGGHERPRSRGTDYHIPQEGESR